MRCSSIKKFELSEYISVAETNMIEMILKVIDLMRTDNNSFFIDVIGSFIEIYNSNNNFLSIRIILSYYIQDFKKFYNITSDLILNYKRLEDKDRFIDVKDGSISLIYYVENYFLSEFQRDNNFTYYFMVLFFQEKSLLSRTDILDLIYHEFDYHGINLCFKLVKKDFSGKLLQILNLGTSRIHDTNKAELIRILDDEATKFKVTNNITTFYKSKVNWTEDERIRLIHGRYSTHNLRWNLIKNDFTYGLYLHRTAVNAHHDAFKSIVKSKKLYYYLLKAIRWSIEDFTVPKYFSMIKLKINETDELMKIYLELNSYDKTNFKNITVDDLQKFYYNFLKEKVITFTQYNNLVNELSSFPQKSYYYNSFIEKDYIDLFSHNRTTNVNVFQGRPKISYATSLAKKLENVDKLTSNNTLKLLADLKKYVDEKFDRFYANFENKFNSLQESKVEICKDLSNFQKEFMDLKTLFESKSNNPQSQDVSMSAICDKDFLNKTKIKLKQKFGINAFTCSQSRDILFTSKNRPTIELWKSIFEELIKQNFIQPKSNKNTKSKIKYEIVK